MKPIKLNGDLKNLDVKNGLFNKSLINGFCLLNAFSMYLLERSCSLNEINTYLYTNCYIYMQLDLILLFYYYNF